MRAQSAPLVTLLPHFCLSFRPEAGPQQQPQRWGGLNHQPFPVHTPYISFSLLLLNAASVPMWPGPDLTSFLALGPTQPYGGRGAGSILLTPPQNSLLNPDGRRMAALAPPPPRHPALRRRLATLHLKPFDALLSSSNL